jgi:hypothetical protein
MIFPVTIRAVTKGVILANDLFAAVACKCLQMFYGLICFLGALPLKAGNNNSDFSGVASSMFGVRYSVA